MMTSVPAISNGRSEYSSTLGVASIWIAVEMTTVCVVQVTEVRIHQFSFEAKW